MSNESTATKPEEVIKELKSLVFEVNYAENTTTKKAKLDKDSIWEKAKKVAEHLSDDTLPTPTPTRP